MRTAVLLLLLATACGSAAAPPAPPRPALQSLLSEEKFQPSASYTGADTSEDRQPLVSAVNNAIRDVATLPEPLDKKSVRSRLSKLIGDTDTFATEDRDQVYRYAIRIWRAAGFEEETGLFAVPDERVLAQP